MKNWDYGSNGSYFITICTANREHFFGHITNQKMKLNVEGQIATNIWSHIPNQFQYAELGNFIVMPNHVHGILMINKPNDLGIANDANRNDALDGSGVGPDEMASSSASASVGAINRASTV